MIQKSKAMLFQNIRNFYVAQFMQHYSASSLYRCPLTTGTSSTQEAETFFDFEEGLKHHSAPLPSISSCETTFFDFEYYLKAFDEPLENNLKSKQTQNVSKHKQSTYDDNSKPKTCSSVFFDFDKHLRAHMAPLTPVDECTVSFYNFDLNLRSYMEPLPFVIEKIPKAKSTDRKETADQETSPFFDFESHLQEFMNPLPPVQSCHTSFFTFEGQGTALSPFD